MSNKNILNHQGVVTEADMCDRYLEQERDTMKTVAYIVDDDQDDRLFAKMMLEKSGKVHEIRPMRNADELFECLEINGLYDDMDYADENSPVIFLDLHMPKMNGIEILERIRNHPITSDFTVILLTSDQSGQKVQDAYQLQANGYLKKPLILEELNNILDKIGQKHAIENFKTSEIKAN
jgi:CheY-like chemotaxis protein